MTTLEILTGVAAGICLLMPVIILESIIQKKRAEKHLVDIVTREKRLKKAIKELASKDASQFSYDRHIKSLLEALNKTDRRYIAEGLSQPSIKGRKEYTKKIFNLVERRAA